VLDVMQQPTKRIVPTPVGVNRYSGCIVMGWRNCPHARGGEPVYTTTESNQPCIVPTPVGVNRGE